MPVINLNELDTTKLHFSPQKKLGSGTKWAFVNQETQSGDPRIIFKTPFLSFTFDAKEFLEGKDGKYGCKVSLPLDDEEVKGMIGTLKEIDIKMIHEAQVNSKKWFGRELSVEGIEDKYHPLFHPYKDPNTSEVSDKYAPTLSFKVAVKDGKVTCKFFDEEKKRICVDVEEEDSVDIKRILVKGMKARLILRFTGVWFSTIGFGLQLKAEQMRVKMPQGFDDDAFSDSSSDEEDEPAPEPEPEPTA